MVFKDSKGRDNDDDDNDDDDDKRGDIQCNYSSLNEHYRALPQAVTDVPPPTPPAYILSITPYGTEYPFDQFGSAVLVLSSPSFTCTWQARSA